MASEKLNSHGKWKIIPLYVVLAESAQRHLLGWMYGKEFWPSNKALPWLEAKHSFLTLQVPQDYRKIVN